MEISIREEGGLSVLRVSGRLDASHCGRLAEEMDGLLRRGRHSLGLDLEEVGFMSSAGIRVLLAGHRQALGLGGGLSVTAASAAVRSILELSGLAVLLAGAAPAEPPSPAPEAPRARKERLAGLDLEVFDLAAAAGFSCRLAGDPARLERMDFDAACALHLPRGVIALGLGAFGRDFEDCRGRFGEFLAVDGAAACLPTDRRGALPDDLTASGDFTPSVQALYAAVLTGGPSRFARFEAGEGAAPFSALAEAALEMAGAPAAGMVLLAESAGLVGASLKRSPVEPGRDLFSHPEVRDRLVFTAEAAFSGDLVLAAGLVAASPGGLAPFLRPISPALLGHAHAAVFSYRHLPSGLLPLAGTAADLFANQQLRAVLHLLTDPREMTGAGESEFVRGAIWAGPLREVSS